MLLKESTQVSDLPSVEYLKQQSHEITSAQIEYRAGIVKPAGNFQHHSGYWQPNSYTGFAIVSMVKSNPSNSFLNFQLQEIQNELKENLGEDAIYYMLPAESFHQTIANTLSNAHFRKSIFDPGKESSFPDIVERAFKNIPTRQASQPIKMKMIGLSIFGTAIGVLGVFDNEEDYNRITDFRYHFYDDIHLNELGVQMTRPFIGHITLAYVEQHLNAAERNQLTAVVNDINQNLSFDPFYFFIANAELRRYHHLAEFKKESHYPVYHFNR